MQKVANTVVCAEVGDSVGVTIIKWGGERLSVRNRKDVQCSVH